MPDLITAMNFDTAVMTFGVWVDNRLAERNEEGRPVHDLKTLLDIKLDAEAEGRNNAAQIAAFQAFVKGKL